jgi:hypothetical protein
MDGIGIVDGIVAREAGGQGDKLHHRVIWIEASLDSS